MVLAEGWTHIWNRMENPEEDAYTCGQIILTGEKKNQVSGGKTVFSTNGTEVKEQPWAKTKPQPKHHI